MQSGDEITLIQRIDEVFFEPARKEPVGSEITLSIGEVQRKLQIGGQSCRLAAILESQFLQWWTGAWFLGHQGPKGSLNARYRFRTLFTS